MLFQDSNVLNFVFIYFGLEHMNVLQTPIISDLEKDQFVRIPSNLEFQQ